MSYIIRVIAFHLKFRGRRILRHRPPSCFDRLATNLASLDIRIIDSIIHVTYIVIIYFSYTLYILYISYYAIHYITRFVHSCNTIHHCYRRKTPNRGSQTPDPSVVHASGRTVLPVWPLGCRLRPRVCIFRCRSRQSSPRPSRQGVPSAVVSCDGRLCECFLR